ncbi:MAG: AAA family ATPase, partial [Clostridia bacterium]|nr:AAA family ATPase [Clostridia bacterium]
MTTQGRVTSIRFRNEQNGWTVFNISTGGNSVTGFFETVTGICPPLRKDMYVRVTGEYETTKFGRQIKATSVMEIRPTDTEGIYKYLASGLIKFIGPVFARAIVDTFGEDTLDVLDNQPERLKEVKGIGPKRLGEVIKAVKEQSAIRDIMIWLKRYDLPNGLATKIYKTYEKDSVAMLEENPYRLADDIKGVGFKKADGVARLLGLPGDSPFRILSGLRAFLEDRAGEGHTCFPFGDMVTRTASVEYLDIEEDEVRSIAESGEFMQVGSEEDGMAFLPQYLAAEDKIARRLAAILRNGRTFLDEEPDFEAIGQKTGVRFSGEQMLAVRLAACSPAVVLTGGPGTGKTTTTNAIITELERRDMKIVLAAPTGRAAKRMTESTGRPAKTIHRLLEYTQGHFTRNEDNPIKADAIIIDEASMIDTVLMKNLLRAVSDRTKLVIVGDTDQLPSVGAGSVLRDIIASGAIPTVRLTEIYRQAQGSDIIMNAHRVNRGKMPVIDNHKPGTDFRFIEAEEKDQAAD